MVTWVSSSRVKLVVLGVTTVSGGGLALGRPLAVGGSVGGDFMDAAAHVGGGELGEAVAPGVVGDGAPGFGVVLQVGRGFLSREVWEALADQGGHAGHVGGSLAGAREPAVVPSVIELFVGNRSGAIDTHNFGLGATVRGRALATERFNGIGVEERRRPHRQQAGVGAFGGVGNAAVTGINPKPATPREHLQLDPVRFGPTSVNYDDPHIVAVKWSPEGKELKRLIVACA